MNQAFDFNIETRAAASKKYIHMLYKSLEKCKKTFKNNPEKALETFKQRQLKVRTEMAKCSNPDDERMIREKIELSGGFDSLNDIIFEIRCGFLDMLKETEVKMLKEGLEKSRFQNPEALFNNMDKNGDGFLDLVEMQSGLEDFGFDAEHVEMLLLALDTNGDNKVSLEEFVFGCSGEF